MAGTSSSSLELSNEQSLDTNTNDEITRFYYEQERLKTFEDMPVSFLRLSTMAAAGFYYLKRDNIVKCAFCGVNVGCWVEGSDPIQDHEMRSPSCKYFRKLPVGDVFIDNSLSNKNPSTDLKENGYDLCGTIEFKSEPSVNLTTKNNEPSPLIENPSIRKSRAPSFPNYSVLDSRERSYEKWPISLKLKPNILSEAGFFYTGKGDQTICFHCGGGLEDWEETDVPWIEHARWFSKCDYVLLVKGKNFVDEVCGRKTSKAKSKSEEHLSQPESEREVIEDIPFKGSANKQEERSCKADHSNTMCKICYTEEVQVVFIPCGHLVACVKCAFSLTTCVVCRESVTTTVRAYLS